MINLENIARIPLPGEMQGRGQPQLEFQQQNRLNLGNISAAQLLISKRHVDKNSSR